MKFYLGNSIPFPMFSHVLIKYELTICAEQETAISEQSPSLLQILFIMSKKGKITTDKFIFKLAILNV